MTNIETNFSRVGFNKIIVFLLRQSSKQDRQMDQREGLITLKDYSQQLEVVSLRTQFKNRQRTERCEFYYLEGQNGLT